MLTKSKTFFKKERISSDFISCILWMKDSAFRETLPRAGLCSDVDVDAAGFSF